MEGWGSGEGPEEVRCRRVTFKCFSSRNCATVPYLNLYRAKRIARGGTKADAPHEGRRSGPELWVEWPHQHQFT